MVTSTHSFPRCLNLFFIFCIVTLKILIVESQFYNNKSIKCKKKIKIKIENTTAR